MVPGTCSLAPDGWYCTREAGHIGPCAAWPVDAALGEYGQLPITVAGRALFDDWMNDSILNRLPPRGLVSEQIIAIETEAYTLGVMAERAQAFDPVENWRRLSYDEKMLILESKRRG